MLLDAAVLGLLWRWHPTNPNDTLIHRRLKFVVCVAFLLFGLTPAWAFLPGNKGTFFVEVTAPSVVDLGTLRQTERRRFSILLSNTTNSAVLIDHLESSCPCLGPSHVTWLLQPLEAKIFELELDLGKEPTFTGRLFVQLKGWADGDRPAFLTAIQVRVANDEMKSETTK